MDSVLKSQKRKILEGELFDEEISTSKGGVAFRDSSMSISKRTKSVDSVKTKLLIDKIIVYINDSYDMNDIEYILTLNSSIEMLNDVLEYIEDNKEQIFGNDVLLKLFNNYYNKTPIPKINLNIVGPYFYKHYYAESYNEISNFNIYLFGEKHNQINNCIENKLENIYNIPIEDYLNYKMQNSSSFSDLYLEYEKIENDSIEYIDGNLRNIYKKFKKCNDETIIYSDCELFRYHYVDLRFMEIESKYSNSLITIIKDLYNITYELELNSDNIKEEEMDTFSKIYTLFIKKIINIIDIHTNVDKLINFFYTNIVLNNINQKELINSYLISEIESYIKKDLQTRTNTILPRLIKILNIFIKSSDAFDKKKISSKNKIIEIFDIYEIYVNERDNFDKFLNFMNKFLHKLLNILVSIEASTMDIYALSRIFRFYNNDRKYNEPKFVKNVYIYAGTNHILKYCEFIESLKSFKLVTFIEDKSKTCISLQDNIIL